MTSGMNKLAKALGAIRKVKACSAWVEELEFKLTFTNANLRLLATSFAEFRQHCLEFIQSLTHNSS